MFLDWLTSGYVMLSALHKSERRNRPQQARRSLHFEQFEERLALSIVAGGDGTQNTTAPADDPGFANVGIRGTGSGIYLGNGWVLTAAHVGAGWVWFGNTLYNAVANSTVQLTNPANQGYTTNTDLVLYQIDGRPNLPSLSIESASPAVNWNVIMIGNGRDRNASEAFWTSSWMAASSASPYAGYIWAATQNMRWGTNVISSVGIPEGVGVNSETAFATTFTGNTQYDAQGSSGDSGGAVFHKDASGQWELAGVMFAINNLIGQPLGTSVFGDTTFSADLSIYRNQILSVIGAPHHAPSGTSNTVTTPQGTPYTFATADFGFSDPNDTPPDNFLAVKITTLPAAGTLTDAGVAVSAGTFVSVADIAAGKLQFAAASGASGAAYASFTFQVQDDGSGADLDPSPKSMTIDVTALDTTPPVVTAFSPTSGATIVAISSTATVTFSEALDPTTVSSSTVYLLAGSTPVAAAVAYNAGTNTVTLTPTSPLANSTTYTIVVAGGGVKDLAGNALVTNATSSFTTVAAPVVVSSLWPLSTVPSTPDSGDGQAVELGVRFVASTSGYIEGIRYFKSAANAGVHTGSLWTASGQLLATATFTGEGGSGWQVVMFSTPVAVAAGATYVASYHTNLGHYAVTRSMFNSPFTSGPLTVPAGGGVYHYGASGFPSQSYMGSNYWVDVLFSTTAPVDTTPPVVTAFTPTGGATSVPINASVTVTFSEGLTAATVNSGTVFLTGGGAAVAASVSYNAATHMVTLTPQVPLANSTTYTVVVVGGASGVKDLAGNALVTNATSSFTTVATTVTTGAVSLWSLNATPAIPDSGDPQAVELGVKFIPSVSGTIDGVRFYKSAANTGVHTGSLWSASGQLLATATFTGEGGNGWQQVLFATPVAVAAATTYVASYHTSVGHYAVNRGMFTSSFVSGALTVPAGGGLYRYGASGFPSQSYQGSNYWVDVLFSPSA